MPLSLPAGCYVQSDSEGVQKDEAVDLVLGNNCKINIVEAIENYAADPNPISVYWIYR